MTKWEADLGMGNSTKCSQENTELFNVIQSNFGQEARIDKGMEGRKNQMGYIGDPNNKEKLKECTELK